MKLRAKLVFGADCDTMEQYILKTGQQMPLLVVIISDVMGSLIGDVDRLLVDLVSKARALGIVSLQTPTNQNTQWHSNLSTVFCGQLTGRSNDVPALGIADEDIVYRPSQLPSPKKVPGVFIVRSGQDQLLVKTPKVREGYLEQVVGGLPSTGLSVCGRRGVDLASQLPPAQSAEQTRVQSAPRPSTVMRW